MGRRRCCCDESSHSSSSDARIGCTPCQNDTAPFTWKIVLAGITNGVRCSECTNINGTYYADYSAADSSSGVCVWYAPITPERCDVCTAPADGYYRVKLSITGTTITIQLLSSIIGSATWSKNYSPSEPNCCALVNEILAATGGTSACFSPPGTVCNFLGSTATITALGCN